LILGQDEFVFEPGVVGVGGEICRVDVEIVLRQQVEDAHGGDHRYLPVVTKVKERGRGDHTQRSDVVRGNVMDDLALLPVFRGTEVFGTNRSATKMELLTKTVVN